VHSLSRSGRQGKAPHPYDNTAIMADNRPGLRRKS
jgi:hypothetical protein